MGRRFTAAPALLFGLGSASKRLSAWLLTLGAFGVFGICLLDSALVPLPGGPDAALIAMSTVNPRLMPLYVVAATIGSAIGSTFLYLVARQAGVRALRGVSQARRERVEGLLGKYDMLAVMVPAILPPPFPFKVFVLSAGAFKLKIVRFMLAILIGRAIRFLIEGLLAVRYGHDAFNIIKHFGAPIVIIVLMLTAIIVTVKVLRRRRNPEVA